MFELLIAVLYGERDVNLTLKGCPPAPTNSTMRQLSFVTYLHSLEDSTECVISESTRNVVTLPLITMFVFGS